MSSGFAPSRLRPTGRRRRWIPPDGAAVKLRPVGPAETFPLELLERLAATTPRPETNLLICHGLLAARAG